MIFVDTSYLLALINPKDKYNKRAIELKKILGNEKRVINSSVLLEFTNSLGMYGSNKGNEIIQIIKRTHEIIYLNEEDYESSEYFFINFDGNINFSDCTILKTMENKKIHKIVSFDSDFDKVNGIVRIH